jgi:hypothetical protein
MWNGAAPNLKAMPATMKTMPVSSRVVEPAAPLIAARSRLPVAP